MFNDRMWWGPEKLWSSKRFKSYTSQWGKMTASENTHGHFFTKMPFDIDHNFRIGKEKDLIFVFNIILPQNPEILKSKKTLMCKTLYQFIVKDFLPSRFLSKDCITRISSVQSLSHVWLFATPWTAARQASLSITNSRSPPKPMSIVSVMPSNHLILCHPLLLLPSIFPSIKVFSNESVLRMRWPKYWSFSFSISPSNKGWTGWISLHSKGLTRIFSNTIVQKHQFFNAQLSLQSNSHIHTWLLEKP